MNKYQLLCLVLFVFIGNKISAQDANSNFERGLNDFRNGNYSSAKYFFLQSINEAETEFGATSEEYAYRLYLLASVHSYLQEYRDAESLLQRAKDIACKLYDDNPKLYLNIIYTLGLVYGELGNLTDAEQLIRLRAQKLERDDPDYTKIVRNLANLYNKLNQKEKADSLYSLLDEQTGTSGLETARYLSDKAIRYYNDGNLIECKRYMLLALPEVEANVPIYDPFYIQFLNNLGTVYKELKELDKAEEIYIQALNLKQNINSATPENFTILSNLAKLYTEKREFDKCEKYFNLANNILFAVMNTYLPYLSESERSIFWNNFKINTDWYLSFGINRIKSSPSIIRNMYDYVLLTKSTLFNTSLMLKEIILSSEDENLINIYSAWQKEKEKLAKLGKTNSKNIDKIKPYADSLRNMVINLEKEVLKLSEKYAEKRNLSGLSENRKSFTELTSVLDDDEAIIDVVKINYSDQVSDNIAFYLFFIIKHNSEAPELVILRNGIELESTFFINYKKNHNREILLKDNFSFQNYWELIQEKLQGINTVYFSPDGVYNQINLNTIQVPGEGYLIDKLSIYTVTNIKQLVNYKVRSEDSLSNKLVLSQFDEEKVNNEAVLIGAPDFGENDNENEGEINNLITYNSQIEREMNMYIGGLEPLDGAEEEIKSIDNIFHTFGIKTNVYLKTDASELELKQVKNPKILHIATHGFFLRDNQIRNQSLINQNSNDDQTNPLLRSGLFFAGVKEKEEKSGDDHLKELGIGEDGILTAAEALNLQLNNTECVVLSACKTAVGDVVCGEGVFGLLRAFQEAGAKAVVASLWKVDDYVTVRLMGEFYRYWMKSGDKISAFRYAQLELKKEKNNPYYWGAFVMYLN